MNIKQILLLLALVTLIFIVLNEKPDLSNVKGENNIMRENDTVRKNDTMRENVEIKGIDLSSIAAREKWLAERMITNLDYITHDESYIPADPGIDLQRIERFVFVYHINVHGYGLVIDKMYERVYFHPSIARVWRLDLDMFSAEYKETDLNNLINALSESDIWNWETHYQGEKEYEMLTIAWIIGALFDDGTILRRSGSGTIDGEPPNGQLGIIGRFVKDMGAEIERRHYAEGGEKPHY
ncbi:MAG: hypothetical protein LBC96_07470 [Lachnospiraceae bacterium]|jgi:hypothetical protein|nr:hypothetical protein [Lachnospiraceae bacterium]